ncbi:MAG: sulfotransferase domain-containing protein [Candidatus Omnitrophica bacterium]|nr:sulfotransferase domain-containing protein [Candidatus Omnitrophota bacterium]
MRSLRLVKRKCIAPNILLIDGIARSGKFLLGKIVSHFKRIEYFQYSPMLDQIPVLWKTRVFEHRSAVAYLQLVIDNFVYNRIIGRNLNLREADHSSIDRSLERSAYLDRAKNPDVKKMLSQFYSKKRVPSLVVHGMLPLIEPYFEAFAGLKIIHTRRHPVDLVHSWNRRRWGVRFFSPDRRSFVPVFQGARRPLGPWFAFGWKDAARLSPIDRVIKSILTIAGLEKKKPKTLDPTRKKRIFFTCFEDIIQRPDDTVRALSDFLKAKPHPRMKSILRREGCYRRLAVGEGKKKLDEIRKEASARYFRSLETASREYEREWNLESYFDA